MDECKREFSSMMTEIGDIQNDVNKLTESIFNQRNAKTPGHEEDYHDKKFNLNS